MMLDRVLRRRLAAIVGSFLLGCRLLSGISWAAEPAAVEVHTVADTFNGEPFEYGIGAKESKETYDLWHLSYPSPVATELPQNNTIPAEYYLPKDLTPQSAKRPAVICMHILGGNFELARMMCASLAAHGIPAIMFKLPYYGERGPAEGPRLLAQRPELFVESLTQGMLDVRRTVDLLASRPEVDAQHLGITGISLGGIVAATAAGLEPRLSTAVPILAGGDLSRLLMTCRETTALRQAIERLSDAERAELTKALAAVDPLEHAAALRPRAQAGHVLMINAAQDEIIPREHTLRLADALGIRDRVVWLEGLGHYTAIAALPQTMKAMVAFFSADLPADARREPPVVAGETPLKTLAGLLAQANTFLSVEPKPETCHLLDVEIQLVGKDATPRGGRIRYLRGSGSQFRLAVTLPSLGQFEMGHGQFPWAVAHGKRVFLGTRDAKQRLDGPMQWVLPQYRLKIQMASGMLSGMVVAPEIVEQFVTLSDTSAADGPQTLTIVSREGKGSAQLVLAQDRRTPEKITVQLKGTEATLTVRDWRTGVPALEGMFAPPEGLPVQDVEPSQLDRIFAALINFGLERL